MSATIGPKGPSTSTPVDNSEKAEETPPPANDARRMTTGGPSIQGKSLADRFKKGGVKAVDADSKISAPNQEGDSDIADTIHPDAE